MAEPATTTGAKPLTEAEQKTLDDLLARQEQVRQEQAEADRAAKLATLAPVEALLKLVSNDKITAAINAVINDPNIDFDTKQFVQSYRQVADYNLGQLSVLLSGLSPSNTGATA